MSRSVVNAPIKGMTVADYKKPKGKGRRKPTLLPEGTIYGRLTATGEFEFRERRDGRNRAFQKFECECGNYVWLRPYTAKNGNTTSCGCLHSQVAGDRGYEAQPLTSGSSQHGESKTRLYKRWMGIMQRCYNSSNSTYRFYGGRGIGVVKEWHDFLTFKEWALSTGFEESLELDRVNPDLDYGPDNCRWITKRENIKRSRRVLDPRTDEQLRSDAIAQGLSTEALIARIVEEHYSSRVAEEVMQTNVR